MPFMSRILPFKPNDEKRRWVSRMDTGFKSTAVT